MARDGLLYGAVVVLLLWCAALTFTKLDVADHKVKTSVVEQGANIVLGSRTFRGTESVYVFDDSKSLFEFRSNLNDLEDAFNAHLRHEGLVVRKSDHNGWIVEKTCN